MRMDRYEEEEKTNDTKQTRTNKNQELYTDVYLNNVYVDINNLKEVMERENFEEDNNQETLKVVKETLPTSHPYQEKNYDIVSIIDEAIKNKKDDNLKRNLDIENINSLEIDSIIESINESQKEEEKELKKLKKDIRDYFKVMEGYFPKATSSKARCIDCCYRNICIK